MNTKNYVLKFAGVLLGIFLINGVVIAQEQDEEVLSGKELLAGCEQGALPGQPNQYCMQYIFGLVQTVVMLQQFEPEQPQLFCIDPNSVGLPEVTGQVVEWLKASRDRLNEDAYVLVSEALHSKYPCKTSGV